MPTTEAWDWQAQASCRGMASSFFFHPWGERGPSRDQRVLRAKEVCASCPVIDACRQHALEVQEQYGVWGGLSEEERLVLLNRGRRSLRRKVLAKSADLRDMMASEQFAAPAADARVGAPTG
ncbi:WhiB family transcriptional regulator [Nakamurella sp.]|uniref:WhiB family transcriptional regulator n=1 Tax=Nakamurella sp. TaxID=1869182 RepID=UPI003B3A42ED